MEIYGKLMEILEKSMRNLRELHGQTVLWLRNQEEIPFDFAAPGAARASLAPGPGGRAPSPTGPCRGGLLDARGPAAGGWAEVEGRAAGAAGGPTLGGALGTGTGDHLPRGLGAVLAERP